MDVVPSDNKGNFIHQMLTCQVSDWQFVFNRNIIIFFSNKRQRTPKGQSTMDIPEKLATQSTQDGEKQNKAKQNIT